MSVSFKAVLVPVEADGLYDVLAVSQDVVCDSPGKQRVTLEYGQAVPDALADTAFLGSFQPRLDFLNALGWLHGVHGVFFSSCCVCGCKLCHSLFKLYHILFP